MRQTLRHSDMIKHNNRNKFNNRGRSGGGGRPGGGNNNGGNHRSNAAQRQSLQQTFERYLSLAREASGSGDRILAENYYQYAEHYLRTLNEMKPVEIEIPVEEVLNESVGEVVATPKKAANEKVLSEKPVSEDVVAPVVETRRRRERPQTPLQS